MIARDLFSLAAADATAGGTRPVRQALAEKAAAVEIRLSELEAALPPAAVARAEAAACEAKRVREDERFGGAAAAIQARMRGAAVRRELSAQRSAAITIQARRRGVSSRAEWADKLAAHREAAHRNQSDGGDGDSPRGSQRGGIDSMWTGAGPLVMDSDDLELAPPPPPPPLDGLAWPHAAPLPLPVPPCSLSSEREVPRCPGFVARHFDVPELLIQLERASFGGQGSARSPATTALTVRASQRKAIFAMVCSTFHIAARYSLHLAS